MKILLIEDNEGDQLILKEAFQEANVKCDLDIVADGEEALNFLKRQGRFKDAKKPDLIILDLNLPRKNGREVLSVVKADERLGHIPVVVLSNSNSPADICSSYQLKASAYVGKPSDFQGFVDFAQVIRSFWVGLVQYCSHN